ncbi:MAG: hypothetical protein OXH07_05340 [Chloroflexi bacterium]|nr:hypothetical protein [Chloroflexota bacterium]
MAILGITNRTENWKTARTFAPLFEYRSAWLARRLLPHRERARIQPGDTHLELFWCGLRDHLHPEGNKLHDEAATLANIYSSLFGDLGKRVMGFEAGSATFKAPEGSYDISREGGPSKLASNLRHTEIDIVVESPSHLFIGEAKHESRLGADGKDFLTHQLIRQYVMACVLLNLRGESRTVVPFVVGKKRNDLRRTLQVQFMIEQKWMREENVLEWSDIEALW